MPGSVAEMNAFQEMASATSNLCINCYFPDVKLNLQDKESFSLVYNRLYSLIYHALMKNFCYRGNLCDRAQKYDIAALPTEIH